MGLFGRFLRVLPSSSDEHAGGATTLTCDCCGCEVDENVMEEGLCEECLIDYDSGTKYCCGAIYEEGEDTCMSCGEPL